MGFTQGKDHMTFNLASLYSDGATCKDCNLFLSFFLSSFFLEQWWQSQEQNTAQLFLCGLNNSSDKSTRWSFYGQCPGEVGWIAVRWLLSQKIQKGFQWRCQSINLHKCEGEFVKLCKQMNVLLRHTKCKHPHFRILRPSPILEPQAHFHHTHSEHLQWCSVAVLSMTLQKFFSHPS